MISGRILQAVLAATALAAVEPSVSAADPKPMEAYSAFVADLGTGRTGVVDIALYRWSTDEEREMLLSTLQEFGRDKLVDSLKKIEPRLGYVRPPLGWTVGAAAVNEYPDGVLRKTADSIGWDLSYARDHRNADGTRRVVLASDRPVSFREVSGSKRSMDYRVTIIELHLDASGKGEGKLAEAAKLTWDKDTKKLEIENYNALPVDLLQVKVTRGSR